MTQSSVPHNLGMLVPGDMAEEERVRRWLAYEDARIKAVGVYEEAKSKARRDALEYEWDEMTYNMAIAEAQIVFHEEAEVKAREILKTPSNPEPTGTCYQDAWRYLIKREEEVFLVHGTVQLHEGTSYQRGVKHAWVELTTGWVWEPQTAGYFTLKDFEITCPVEEVRYTKEEASIMVARTGNTGPWSAEERAQYIGR